MAPDLTDDTRRSLPRELATSNKTCAREARSRAPLTIRAVVEVYLYPLGVVVLFGLFFWLPTQFRYRITDRALKVTLFGIPVRRIRLEDIRYIGTHRSGWGEHWVNSWSKGRRYLVIRRRSGLFRDFLITPRNRFVFRADLQRKIDERRAASNEPPANPHRDPSPSTSRPDLQPGQ